MVRCYDLLEVCRACGIIDFTDGLYQDVHCGRRAYLAAQQRQADYLLDQVGCRRGSRLLDIGCGYGRLLDAAAARGADAIGLTISPPQAQQNRAAGRAVELCNYRSLLVDGRHEGWER
ncbi:MAG TPA: class I SAM-dependent methyltransferase, partial [Lacipirellulaceae bacterium]|nr:class I SAM-dependent methyltransferase [Lacipirellulaceae bacterium]